MWRSARIAEAAVVLLATGMAVSACDSGASQTTTSVVCGKTVPSNVIGAVSKPGHTYRVYGPPHGVDPDVFRVAAGCTTGADLRVSPPGAVTVAFSVKGKNTGYIVVQFDVKHAPATVELIRSGGQPATRIEIRPLPRSAES